MKLAVNRGQVLKFLRTMHSWLGLFVFPWVILIGATGFYLNHWKPILRYLNGPGYDEAQFDTWQAAAPVTRETALAVARNYWPEENPVKVKDVKYHHRKAISVSKPSGRIIVTKPTGHYFVKTLYTRRTFAPDGTLLDSKIYWARFFKRLHTEGWPTNRFGTWLADLTSVAMVVFGVSGIFLWWLPRSRRIMRALRPRHT
ncbi:MAG: PepSY domain-containing protein [Paracoccaceae bacterium]